MTRRITEDFGRDSYISQEWAASGCMGKAAFDSPKTARKVAGKANITLHHYRCRVCGMWHVGRPPR